MRVNLLKAGAVQFHRLTIRSVLSAAHRILTDTGEFPINYAALNNQALETSVVWPGDVRPRDLFLVIRKLITDDRRRDENELESWFSTGLCV